MENEEYNSLLSLVRKRRSYRRFKPDPIPDEIVDKILEVAQWAPSGFNTQPWEFVILTEEEHRKKIVEITSSYWTDSVEMEKAREEWQGRTWNLKGMTDETGDYSEAPVYILLFGDPRPLDALPMGVQCDKHRKQLIYQASLANTFLYLHLAATTFGLGAQWYSVVQTPYCSCLIKDYLGIPKEFDIFDMIVLGYPAVTPPRKYQRKLEDIRHWGIDNKGKFRSDEEVRDFVKKTRAWVTGCHAKKAKTD